MKRIATYLLPVLLGLTLTACKDDKEDVAPSKTTLLTQKNWRISAIVGSFNLNGVNINTDAYATIKACEKDDFLKFESNKDLIYNEGSVKCNTSNDQTQKGRWELVSGESELLLQEPDGNSQTVKIEELSASTLRVSTTLTLPNIPVPATGNITFTSF